MRENWVTTVRQWLVLASTFAIPVSSWMSIKLILIAFIFSFYPLSTLSIKLIKFWDIAMYLLVLLIGVAYSNDISTGFKVLETNFSLLAFVIIFSQANLSGEKVVNHIFVAFIVGLCCSSIVCLINGVVVFSESSDPNSFYSYNLTGFLDFHPTYFAYYLIFAITYLLYSKYYDNVILNPSLDTILILFLFLVLMLTGGKTTFIGMLFTLSFFILKFIIDGSEKRNWLVFSLILIMISFMFLTPLIEESRISGSWSDSWERLILWESAMQAIPNILLGVGTGDYKVVLNEYFVNHNLAKFADESFNSHNQFIQLLFTNGILGVISLGFMIGHPLYLGVKNKSVLIILSIFPFLIYGVTEVFLGRYQGVVFFGLLHQAFISQIISENTSRKLQRSN